MGNRPQENLEFDAVHEEYRQRILRYLEGMVGPAEAEELTQETFLKIAMCSKMMDKKVSGETN